MTTAKNLSMCPHCGFAYSLDEVPAHLRSVEGLVPEHFVGNTSTSCPDPGRDRAILRVTAVRCGRICQWFCWIVQVEPYRHIHVRHLRFTLEVECLYEGLTGRKWGD